MTTLSVELERLGDQKRLCKRVTERVFGIENFQSQKDVDPIHSYGNSK